MTQQTFPKNTYMYKGEEKLTTQIELEGREIYALVFQFCDLFSEFGLEPCIFAYKVTIHRAVKKR